MDDSDSDEFDMDWWWMSERMHSMLPSEPVQGHINCHKNNTKRYHDLAHKHVHRPCDIAVRKVYIQRREKWMRREAAGYSVYKLRHQSDLLLLIADKNSANRHRGQGAEKSALFRWSRTWNYYFDDVRTCARSTETRLWHSLQSLVRFNSAAWVQRPPTSMRAYKITLKMNELRRYSLHYRRLFCLTVPDISCVSFVWLPTAFLQCYALLSYCKVAILSRFQPCHRQ